MRMQMDEWVNTVQRECIVVLQAESLENLHVHQFIQDGCDYVCVQCGLLSEYNGEINTPLYAVSNGAF